MARLYLEGVDPEAYRLLDLPAVREAARAPCSSSWNPSSWPRPCRPSCPTMDTLGGQWDGYLADQDLTGLDRDRVRRLGHDTSLRPSKRREADRRRGIGGTPCS